MKCSDLNANDIVGNTTRQGEADIFEYEDGDAECPSSTEDYVDCQRKLYEILKFIKSIYPTKINF